MTLFYETADERPAGGTFVGVFSVMCRHCSLDLKFGGFLFSSTLQSISSLLSAECFLLGPSYGIDRQSHPILHLSEEISP